MEVGTGIFLGLVFLGLVLLYVKTRGLWRWKRIVSWLLIAAFILLAGGFGLLYLVERHNDRPQIQSELWGLRLGLPKNEVRYLKGEPTRVDEGDFVYSVQSSNSLTYFVQFDRADRVKRVAATAMNRVDLPWVQGLSGYSSLDRIEAKFGKPTHVSTSENGLRRLASFAKYNIAFGLERDEVWGIVLFDGSGEPVRFSAEFKQ